MWPWLRLGPCVTTHCFGVDGPVRMPIAKPATFDDVAVARPKMPTPVREAIAAKKEAAAAPSPGRPKMPTPLRSAILAAKKEATPEPAVPFDALSLAPVIVPDSSPQAAHLYSAHSGNAWTPQPPLLRKASRAL